MNLILEESRQGMIDCKQLLTAKINIGGDDL
jgi:PTS system mannose-specific IIA component/fructoselysine and glucoselysine-specific PTS system IIA component